MVNRNKGGGNMYNAFSCFMGNDDIDVLIEYFKKYFAQFEVDVGVKPFESANIPDCIQTEWNVLNYKGYLYKQRDGHSIYIDNTGESWCSLIWNVALTNKLDCLTAMIYDTPPYPGYKLCRYFDGKERVIQNIKDGSKWCFFQKGEVCSFENTGYYAMKRGAKKFDYEIMKEYLVKLGLNIEDNDFWTPKGEKFLFYRLLRGQQ